MNEFTECNIVKITKLLPSVGLLKVCLFASSYYKLVWRI